MKRITLSKAIDLLAEQGYEIILTDIHVTEVVWRSPSGRIKNKMFVRQTDAAKYIIKRQHDPRFEFIRMIGPTWVVTSLETVKAWANQ